MDFAIVIVFFNPEDNNIKKVYNLEKETQKIYVVDNSEDNTIRIKETPKIEYIKFKKNKGIAYALNYAANLAIKKGFKWLMTLDQDSEISCKNIKDIIDFLKKNQNDDKIGIVSPVQDIGDEIKYTNLVDDVIEIMTSGNIINLSAYQKIGGFKNWLFIDCVDTDYCLNLHKNGYKVLRLNRVVMKHHLGNRTYYNFLGKKYDCSNHNPVRRYYITRNNLYINKMYKKDYPDYCKKLLRIQQGQIKRIIMFEKNKIKKIYMVIRGFIDYKKGIKGKMKGKIS